MASEGLESMKERQRRWIPDPLKGLPICDYPYVVHGDDGVEERYEAFLVVRLGKPRGMVEQTEWRPVFATTRERRAN